MKQQWETERYAAVHTDRTSHRNPIIISDCNLRTLYQSGNSYQLSMTTQDLLHYASTETADMDEKEKILQPAQHPYIRQHQVSRDSSCWRTAQHKKCLRQSQRSFKNSGSPPAYYTIPPPTTTERDVSALTLQLNFDTRNPDFPAQGLGSRPGPTHSALARNLTISWSMASGLTRLGTVEPKIV